MKLELSINLVHWVLVLETASGDIARFSAYSKDLQGLFPIPSGLLFETGTVTTCGLVVEQRTHHQITVSQ